MGDTLRRETWPIRLAVLGLTGLIFVGSLIMVALPFVWLWLLSHLSLEYAEVYFLALAGCPAAIVSWGWVLVTLNRIYLQLAGEGSRSVLETSITLAVVIAVVALVVWWAFIPDVSNPSGPLQPI